MNPHNIESTFPKGHRLPAPIVDICTFLNANGYPISGCFELSTIGVQSLKGWFRRDPFAHEQFLPFGRGASGDIYALWLTNNLSPDQDPVVMFGSEGELVVLACNSEQFCKLLCLGYSEIGLDDPTAEPTEFVETEPFRHFMIKLHGFKLPPTAEPIIAEAKEKFPSFASWVERRQ